MAAGHTFAHGRARATEGGDPRRSGHLRHRT